MKDLGGLVPGGYGQAWDVNDSGQVVGLADSLDASGTPATHIFLWTPGGTDGVPSNPPMKDLQIPWGGLSYLAINKSGVVVGNEATSAGRYHAFVWDQDRGGRDLNDLVPSDLGVELRYATAIDYQGKIVADGWNIGGPAHAYMLFDNNHDGDFKDPNEVTDLGTLRGATSAGAYAINDVGQVAGGSGSNAVIWQNGVMKSLGQFHKEAPTASGINHSSVVVGYTINYGAWAWTGSGSITGLNDLIPRNSRWNLLGAFGISDAGTIVGYGTPPSGGPTHAFLVTPTSAPAVGLTTSAASLTAANTLSLAPLEAGARSPRFLTDTQPSSAGPQDSSILIGLTPASDQDLTPFVTELIRSGTKRPRPSSRG
jgi:probable HAF family extracellular repeat protein